MKMKEIRQLAKNREIKIPFVVTKIEAVRMIQRSEGNFDCFARACEGFCDQSGCIFYQDCMELSPKE
ncbi:hypothetical protein [Desulfonatronovibrio hydrogenovorans]|uniref:hypothetical protein n=1 Tax=Desulfonatronovibrio hydrogenovorans TaxID=53245 RepID=UPI00048EC964|nr:hypothetical protein [Desulfonatronovibrio hydrogenovorans]